jgi:hypothetical protein
LRAIHRPPERTQRGADRSGRYGRGAHDGWVIFREQDRVSFHER